MSMKEYLSLVPGPCQVNQRVLDALSQQIVTHRNEGWSPYYRNVCKKVAKIFGTNGEVFLMASSGTGAMEAAIGSTVSIGEKLLALSNGYFGDRFGMVADSYHLETEIINFPVDESIDPDILEQRLQKGLGNIAAVGVVQCESQTGILNPIKEIAQICNEHNVLLIVDAVSSLGGVELMMDEWGVDIVIGATQKAFGGVVGISMVAVNNKSWKYFENKKGTGYYFNLNYWRDCMHNSIIHPHPFSMSESLIFSVDAAADLIFEEGLENRWKRHWDLYDFYARELGRLGFLMYMPRSYACPTVISMNKYQGISIEDFAQRLKNEYRILIGVGIYQQHGKIFRIGNMAEQAKWEKAQKLVNAVSEILCTL